MQKIHVDFVKFLVLSLVLTQINCYDATEQTSGTDLSFLNFEEIKNDFFQNSDFNISSVERGIDIDDVSTNLKCLKQMLEIQRGLQKFEKWAMERKLFCDFFPMALNYDTILMVSVVDAWGKMPSGFFSGMYHLEITNLHWIIYNKTTFLGNLYELGEFSQCLNIKRDGKRYETKYCVGQLIFNGLNMVPMAKTFSSNWKHRRLSGFLQMGKHQNIDEFMLTP